MSFRCLTCFLIMSATLSLRAEDSLVPLEETHLPPFFNGKVLEPKMVWEEHRRDEILRLFEQHVFGKAPEEGYQLTFEVMDESDLDSLKARRIKIATHVQTELGSLTIRTVVFLPLEVHSKIPVFLGMHLFDSNKEIPIVGQPWNDPDHRLSGLAEKDPTALLHMIFSRGYGLATIDANDVDPDNHDGFLNGVHGLFHSESQRPHGESDWGTLAAWAWGLSRSLDALETLEAIDSERVFVIGHSRMGKAALWAGARDERFAMVISNNSGCGGAAISRRKKGETVAHINRVFPHWFCQRFHAYGNKEDQLPVDQHMLVALSAPRPVYVASAEEDAWADPFGEFLSAYYASEIYRYHGLEGLSKEERPVLNHSIGSRVGYHLRSGRHDITAFDWLKYLEFADRHF